MLVLRYTYDGDAGYSAVGVRWGSSCEQKGEGKARCHMAWTYRGIGAGVMFLRFYITRVLLLVLVLLRELLLLLLLAEGAGHVCFDTVALKILREDSRRCHG